ncbi:MAG: hypothetical protein Q8S39_14810 [Ignavibacteria bacterium]|nr:hypothetical protein [Ignavibacteria bacterium]
MKKYFFLTLLIIGSNLLAQQMTLGFRVEPFLYSGGYNIDRPDKDETNFYLSSFYLTSSFTVNDFFQTQFRLGYLATKSRSYNGLEVTALLLLNYKSGFAPTVGLNFHKNNIYEGDYISVKKMVIVSQLVGFEGRFGENFQCGITIQFPINNEFIEYGASTYHVRYLIKCSFGWEFVL